MTAHDSPEANGRRAAAKALAAGAPRWCLLGPTGEAETLVDRTTGLPIQVVSGMPAAGAKRYVAGYNAEIARAKLAAEVRLDLRPFLTTREALAALFRVGPLGTLAAKRPIDLLGAAIRYEVLVPRPPKAPPRSTCI